MTKEAMPTEAVFPPGTLVHHSSEECGPADVGLCLQLTERYTLWCGEITSTLAAEHNIPDAGWWIVIDDDEQKSSTPVAQVHGDSFIAQDFMEVLAGIIREYIEKRAS